MSDQLNSLHKLGDRKKWTYGAWQAMNFTDSYPQNLLLCDSQSFWLFTSSFMYITFGRYLRGNVKKKSAYLKTLSKRWGGGQGLFKKILMNLFLILCGGNSLFNNEDTTYF